MEFDVRYSNNFGMNIFMIMLAFVLALISYIYRTPTGFKHYGYILWLILFFIRSLQYARPIYLSVTKKKILIVNELYLYDAVSKVKYYWQDIDELYEKHSYLFIRLYDPGSYANKTYNTFKRLINRLVILTSSKKSPYFIDMDIVNVNPNMLLELIDNYSLQASPKENVIR